MRAEAKGFVPRIQGLRAVAVLSVLIFHIWPAALPGGYVGVDVFFVISGYLITGLLQRELTHTGDISLLSFYTRRIRRLLPAATLTLLCVCLAIPFLPGTRWHATAIEVLASAFYVENWWLGVKAVDYLASGEPHSPVMHYWSLSIEEQWYIVWPLLLLLSARLSRGTTSASGAAGRRVLLVICASSFLCSVWLTQSRPSWAYFASVARVWELALGGLLALTELHLRALGARTASALGLAGLMAIGLATSMFDAHTPFPGFHAALPTLGAALIILSARHSVARWNPLAWLETGPARFVGDISYSLYLWHWPLVVFGRHLVWGEGHVPSAAQGIVVGIASILLATLGKAAVEDRFRERIPQRARGTFGIAAASMLSCAVVGAVVLRWDTSLARQGRSAEAPLRARAMAARDDLPDIYGRCHAEPGDSGLVPCHHGSRTSASQVVLAGDSHAAAWVPAFAELSQQMGFRLTSYTRSACPIADLSVLRVGAPYPRCTTWREALFDQLVRDRPQLVLLTQRRDYEPADATLAASPGEAMLNALGKTYHRLVEAGLRVMLIADTPGNARDVPDCLSSYGATASSCDGPPVADVPDPILQARNTLAAPVLELNELICPQGVCRALKGRTVVWRDAHHITASFARTLAEPLREKLTPFLSVYGMLNQAVVPMGAP